MKSISARAKRSGRIPFLLLTVLVFSSCRPGPGESSASLEQFDESELKSVKSEYVSVAKKFDRFWLAGPNGAMLGSGVSCVQPLDWAAKPGSRKYDALAQCGGDKKKWIDEAVSRLKEWNFNVIAAWSDDDLCMSDSGLFHTKVVWYGGYRSDKDMRLVDVFSDGYAAKIAETGLKEVVPFARNKSLIGFFINNELPWYGECGWPTGNDASLVARYMELPEGDPGKKRLCEFLKSYYKSDFAKFKEVWDVQAPSFEELASHVKIRPLAGESVLAASEWAGIVAEKYFSLCEDDVRKNAPNHLVLGCRFAGRPPRPVLEACGRHSDIVSINLYRKDGSFDENLTGAIFELTGKAVWISEFSWRATENSSGCPNKKGAEVLVKTQKERADAYEKYVSHAVSLPFVVAYDWFQYYDQSPEGRSYDGEDSNYGLVDIHDKPYSELVSAAKKVNAEASKLHLQGSREKQIYPLEILADFKPVKLAESEKPLSAPILFADSASPCAIWGDKSVPYKMEKDPGRNSFIIDTENGWGAGISFKPGKNLALNKDGSANLSGARQIRIRFKSDKSVKFRIGVHESGHAAPGAQVYQGENDADGESYSSWGAETGSGEIEERIFRLSDFAPNLHYGNQRGNMLVNTGAIDEMLISFPGTGIKGEFELISMTVE